MRMEAEVPENAHERASLLEGSVEGLRQAIRQFAGLEMEVEVGDCYSLLARTHLVAQDRQAARSAIREADDRLVDPTNKDYLDLQIVKGDLILPSDPQAAESIYTDVLATNGHDDAQKSEVIARAYLQRGKARSALRNDAKAQTDFEQAARIWKGLNDPAADLALWEIVRKSRSIDAEVEALMCEPISVRVRAIQIAERAVAERSGARSHRRALSGPYLKDVIRRARKEVAIARPAW